nr:retrotransposon-derived protein peg10 [Quercus suber]
MNSINASSTAVFRTKVTVNRRRITAMIDSGAGGNFVSSGCVRRYGLATQIKDDGYELAAIDGSPLPRVDRETVPLQLTVQEHQEDITLDVIPMAKWDVVLGIPWLKLHNPIISWSTGMIRFEDCRCIATIEPIPRQSSRIDEVKELNEVQPTGSQNTPNSTDTELVESDHKVRAIEGSNAPSAILEEYKEFKQLFKKDEESKVLPPHQPLRHWRIYAEGSPGLTIYSDHKNLLYFATTKELTRRHSRWAEILGQYKFTIKYTPGKDNGRADALSRRSDYMEGRPDMAQQLLRRNPDGSLSGNTQEFNTTIRIRTDSEEQFPIVQGKHQCKTDADIKECKITQRLKEKSKTTPQLKRGDKVYLLTKNLRSKRPSKKLDAVKVGPFLIKEVRGPVNYLLDLPKDAGRIHPVFHISLLEPADPTTPIRTTFDFQLDDDEYVVEKILKKKGQNYLVKWEGYPSSENTWEPKENLHNCKDLLRRFEEQKKEGRGGYN